MRKPLPDGLPDVPAHIRLTGTIDDGTLDRFTGQLEAARKQDGPLLLELTTTGGDADIGRRIAGDIVFEREYHGRDLVFLGKAAVYSAGVTILSAFPPGRRYLTAGTSLLVHERRMEKTLDLNGAMRANLALVNDTLAEIEAAMAIERRDFARLVEGTELTLDTLLDKVLARDWYLDETEALRLGLIAGVV